MGRPTSCCVPGCNGDSSHRFRFPQPVTDAHNRFGLWLRVINLKVLEDLEPMKVYTNKRVCGKHFSPCHFIPGTEKLKRNAVPDLNLPGDGVQVADVQPSCSTEAYIEPTTSPSNSPQSADVTEGFAASLSSLSGSEMPQGFVRTGRVEGVLQSLGVRKLTDLTPKARRLHIINQQLKKNARRSSKRLVNFRERLQAAEKELSLGFKDSDPNLSQTVSSFLQCQVRESRRKSKGHRFTFFIVIVINMLFILE